MCYEEDVHGYMIKLVCFKPSQHIFELPGNVFKRCEDISKPRSEGLLGLRMPCSVVLRRTFEVADLGV